MLFFSSEDLIEYLDQGSATTPTTTESTVRGYKVKVTHQALSPADIAERRSAVAQVIARSLARTHLNTRFAFLENGDDLILGKT